MLSQYFFHLALKVYAREITRAAYTGILRREADEGGLDSYARAIGKTGDLPAILGDIAASREAWEKHLYGHPEEAVRLVFRGLLDREPEPEALSHYASQLVESKDLSTILSMVGQSQELWEKLLEQKSEELVRAVYQGILGREPDAEDLVLYSGQLAEHLDVAALLSVFEQSREHWEKLFGQKVEEFVRSVFQGLLDREPDPEALALYSGQLAEHRDLAVLLATIKSSREHWEKLLVLRSEELVQSLYRGLLDRSADAEGLRRYTDTLRKNKDVAEILASIVRSDEFAGKRREAVRRSVPSFRARDLDEVKVVFLHIPKTGGTTLHHILVRTFDEKEVCPERFNGLRHYAAGELVRYRFFSGHFDLPSVRLIPGRKKIITMLRDPAARLISLYYFQRAHRPEIIERNKLELAHLASRYSMAEFFRNEEVRSHPAVNNTMTRVLVDTIEGDRWEGKTASTLPGSMPFLQHAVQELVSFDAFGILERFDDSMELICNALGMLPVPQKVEPRQVFNVISREEPGLRPIEKEPVTAEIRRSIEELIQTDSELYRFACRIFDERLCQLRCGVAAAAGGANPNRNKESS